MYNLWTEGPSSLKHWPTHKYVVLVLSTDKLWHLLESHNCCQCIGAGVEEIGGGSWGGGGRGKKWRETVMVTDWKVQRRTEKENRGVEMQGGQGGFKLWKLLREIQKKFPGCSAVVKLASRSTENTVKCHFQKRFQTLQILCRGSFKPGFTPDNSTLCLLPLQLPVPMPSLLMSLSHSPFILTSILTSFPLWSILCIHLYHL